MLESLNNNKKLLPRQAAEQIIKLIRENQLQAGEKLPNEFDMAQQRSVGSGTILEAVKIVNPEISWRSEEEGGHLYVSIRD